MTRINRAQKLLSVTPKIDSASYHFYAGSCVTETKKNAEKENLKLKKTKKQTWSCFWVFLKEALLLEPLISRLLPMLLSPPLSRLSAELPRLRRVMLMLPLLPIMSSRLSAAARSSGISSRISSKAFSLDFWKSGNQRVRPKTWNAMSGKSNKK